MEFTNISLKTNKMINSLIKNGFNAAQIREHYNEKSNTKLNHHINVLVRNSQLKK